LGWMMRSKYKKEKNFLYIYIFILLFGWISPGRHIRL